MNRLPVPASIVFATALVLGALGDVLLRSADEPGLSLFLWIAAIAAGALWLQRRSGQTLSGESLAWIAIAVLFSVTHLWRAAPVLRMLAIMSAAVAFMLPAMRAGAAWVRNSGVGEYVLAFISAGAHAFAGVTTLLPDIDWSGVRGTESRRGWGRAVALVRGTALAVPLLVVFGGLFIAADAVFADMVANAIRFDVEEIAAHVFLTGVLTWVITGALRGFLAGSRLPLPEEITSKRPALGMVDATVALGLLGALFLLFVVVQFRYLFGGAALIEVTPGLTYAEYARRGFFELVMVAVLMLPLLLLADWAVRRADAREERVFRALLAVQIILLFAVMASAVQRMRLYLDAYGLTEDRFYATSLLLLLSVILVLFAFTVMRGRRDRFAYGALVSAFTMAALLFAVNPDALIARTNVARMDATGDAQAQTRFDARYATSLSADAVPVLIDALPSLGEHAQCVLAKQMLRRWSPVVERKWGSWNWSDARARGLVADRIAELRGMAGTADQCPGLVPPATAG